MGTDECDIEKKMERDALGGCECMEGYWFNEDETECTAIDAIVQKEPILVEIKEI